MTKNRASHKKYVIVILLIILILAAAYITVSLTVLKMSQNSSTVYGRLDQISYENLPEAFAPVILSRELPNGNYCLNSEAEKCYFEIQNGAIRFVPGEYGINDLIRSAFGDGSSDFSEFNDLCEAPHEFKVAQFYESSDHNYIIWDWNEDGFGGITSCRGILLNDDGSVRFMGCDFVLS